MSASIREIVNAALTVVGEVTGPGVQIYEEDRMKQDAVRAFNMMFKKYPWQQYLKWFTVELDGASGKIKANVFEQIKDFEDFIAVHRDGEANRLPIAPTRLNPYVIGGPTTPSVPGVPGIPGTTAQPVYGSGGTRVLYWTSLNAADPVYPLKKLQFYPVTAIGFVNVLAKVYPLMPPTVEFDWEQIFYLDKDMLVYATAFMTLSGDDLNAGAADTVRNLMEMKFKDIMAALGSHPIPVEGDASIPYYWHEV